MADARSVVELVFLGIDKTSEATTAALNNAQKFSQSLQTVTAPVADFTKSAIKLEAALLTASAAVVGFSIKVAGDFDTAFREISTLIDAPIEDLDRFRDAILDYSKTSTQPLESITSAIYSAISAGVDYTDSIEGIAIAEKLAVAGKADLGEAMLILVSSLNAYGKGMEDAEYFSDLLFTTVEKGQTTLPELSASLAQVTGLAAPAGVSFEELLSAVAALTSTGTPTAQAITQIRGAISAILKPSGDAANLAAELGIEFDGQRLKAVGLSGVLQDVQQATGGNVSQMTRLFGSVEALGGVMVLTGLGADKFAGNLVAMGDATGAVDAAFEKFAGDISLNNQKIVNALRGVAIEIGDPLLAAYGGVAEAIAAAFNAVGANVEKGKLGDLVKYIESVFVDVEQVFRNIAKNLPEALNEADLSGFIKNVDDVRAGVTKLFSGLDLNTPEGLARAITIAADAFGNLGTFVGSTVGSFEAFLTQGVKLIENINKLGDGFFNVAGQIGATGVVLDFLLPKVDTLLLLLIAGQGGGLAKAFTTVATSAGVLAGALTKLALPLAAGAGLFKIAELVGILYDWEKAASAAASAQEDANRVINTSEGELQRVAAELGIVVSNYDEFWQLVKNGTVIADEASGKWVLATERQGDAISDVARDYDAYVDDVVRQSETAANSQDYLAESMAQIGLVWDENQQAFVKAAGSIEDITDAATGVGTELEKGAKSATTFETALGGTLSFLGGAFDNAKDSAKEAFEQTDAYFLKMLEIASDERIANIEAKVSLDIAQLEADTARVQAAFESIDNTISVTTQSITDLFGVFAQIDRFDQNRVLDQIEKENEVRDEALKKQGELIDAQIDALRAKTDALERGDSLIQVDGAGLQPHLEAFMWEILRTIQVRVNEDGLEMLLGTA